jgi:DNA-binding SARP family transcriptional activator
MGSRRSLQFRVLGPLEAVIDGRVIELGPPKQRAFLAALLVERGRVVSVDRLADLLWDGEPPDRALVSLRAYASNLRKVIEPNRDKKAAPVVLRTVAPGYLLDVADEDIDSGVFAGLTSEARRARDGGDAARACALLDEALALWRGGALADLASEPVARAEVARLEELRLGAIEDRIDAALALGRHRESIGELERLTTAHPRRERLHGLLMLALHRAGRTPEALAVYRDVTERLLDELGLEPGPQLRALEAQIRSGDGDIAAAHAPTQSRSRPDLGGESASEWEDARPAAAATPLVGRRDELDAVRTALDDACAGRGSIVLVTGDAGIGKTRFLEEIAALAQVHPTQPAVAWSRCFEAEDAPPFWPWRQILRAIVEQVTPETVKAMAADLRLRPLIARVPEYAARLGVDIDPADDPVRYGDGDRFLVFDAATGFLVRAAAERPLVVLFDDLHWANAATLQLLAFLASTVASVPLLVVGTYRENEVASSDALGALLAELARVRAARIGLGRLADDDAAALAVALLATDRNPGNDDDTALVDDVVRRAEGNPFFVSELLRLAEDEGGLATSVPAGIGNVIGRRLQRLPERVTTVLTAAAVAGREFDVAVVEAVVDDPGTLDLIDAAADAGLVVEHPTAPGRYAFTHALVQESLLGELAGLRRARLHARIARALESIPANDPMARLTELARHYCAGAPAGTAERAVEVSVEAGDNDMARLAYEDARGHYERALDAMEAGALVDEHRRASTLVSLARACRSSGASAASRDHALEAARVARRIDDAELLSDAGLALAMPGAAVGMDFGWLDRERVEILEAALDGLGPAATYRRVRTVFHLVLALHLDPSRYDERVALAREAIAQADELDDDGLRAGALAALRSTLWRPGQARERADAARELIRRADADGAGQTALEGHIGLAIDLFELGDLAGFQHERDHLDDAALALHMPFYRWYPQVLDAARLALEGRYAESEALATAAADADVDALGRRGAWGLLGWRCIVEWDRGRLTTMEQPLRQAVAAFPDMPALRVALANAVAESGASGATDEAATIAAPLLSDVAGAVPDDSMTQFTLAVLAELAARVDDRRAAEAIRDRLLPARGELIVVGSGVGSTGAVDRTLGVAETTLGRWTEAEAWFTSALARNEELGAVPWAARTRVDWARMLLARAEPGDKERALELLDAARTAATSLGADGLLAAIARLLA